MILLENIAKTADSVLHRKKLSYKFFWDCPRIQLILNDLNMIITDEPLVNTNLREILFLGSHSNLTHDIKTTNIICVTTLFYLFSTRNNNTAYSLNKLIKFINVHTNKLSVSSF